MALYEDGCLLAVCLYRFGAEEVRRRIEGLEAHITRRCCQEKSIEPALTKDTTDPSYGER